ncbi:MAG: hypothetical protein CMN72_07785 [Sphingomonas sp.]|nr:hypothetical protein [Sphingomonas sp.]
MTKDMAALQDMLSDAQQRGAKPLVWAMTEEAFLRVREETEAAGLDFGPPYRLFGIPIGKLSPRAGIDVDLITEVG